MNINVLSIIALVIGLAGFVIALYVIITSSGRFNAIEKNTQNNIDAVNSKINKIQSNTDTNANSLSRGPQGIRGPVGPAGPPGGYYSASGPLINMNNKKVGTPTFGKGEPSIVYLDEKHYSPVQYWFLENKSNGNVVVKNKYTDYCLTANNLGDIYSDICNDSNQSQQFKWGKNMQLMSTQFTNQCIGTKTFSRTNTNSNNNYNFTDLTAKPNSNIGNVEKLSLEACSSSLNPKQTWYVGQ